MLSYQHGFHAGNAADLLKHLVLVNVLDYLTQKNKPLVYIDTHAGAGGYSLADAQAQKTLEFKQGIGQLWALPEQAWSSSITAYLAVVSAFEAQARQQTKQQVAGRFYPGSPAIAQHCLRDDDRLVAYELHPQAFSQLQAHTATDRRVKVYQQNGFQGLIAQVPPKERRGVILIDPPYELKQDYDEVVTRLVAAYKRFATGTYLLWYPVVERRRIDKMWCDLKASGIRNIAVFELGWQADNPGRGMTASGMIVINPPWTLMAIMQQDLAQLKPLIANEQGFWQADMLVAE